MDSGTVPCLVACCPECGAQIRLPLKSLENAFDEPGLRTTDAPFLAFPCPICNSVEAYSINGGSPYKRRGDQVILSSPPEATMLHLGWLECEEPTCKFRIPLFAQWSDSTTQDERLVDIRIWKWDHLLCPQGHAIERPGGRVDAGGGVI